MDVNNINPFIESIHEAFESMLGTPVKQVNLNMPDVNFGVNRFIHILYGPILRRCESRFHRDEAISSILK